MAVRPTMIDLIARLRLLINDPAGTSQIFDDQTIQNILDESRVDYRNAVLKAVPTFDNGTISYLDYYHDLGGWENGAVLKQYLTTTVTPASSEPIVGHWTFAESTLPPVYVTGALHDVYRAAADLLERQSTQWMLRYSMTVDGQFLQRSLVIGNMQKVIQQYRMKQRPVAIRAIRSDLGTPGNIVSNGLGPNSIDYMASGNKR
jgi:hypothetical protein